MRRNIAVISHGETAETQVNVTLPIAVVYVGVFVGNLNQRAIDTHCQPRHVFARNENFVIIHGAAGFCVDILQSVQIRRGFRPGCAAQDVDVAIQTAGMRTAASRVIARHESHNRITGSSLRQQNQAA